MGDKNALLLLPIPQMMWNFKIIKSVSLSLYRLERWSRDLEVSCSTPGLLLSNTQFYRQVVHTQITQPSRNKGVIWCRSRGGHDLWLGG